jgi:hypothetical protein
MGTRKWLAIRRMTKTAKGMMMAMRIQPGLCGLWRVGWLRWRVAWLLWRRRIGTETVFLGHGWYFLGWIFSGK